jgi:hypothetical protein
LWLREAIVAPANILRASTIASHQVSTYPPVFDTFIEKPVKPPSRRRSPSNGTLRQYPSSDAAVAESSSVTFVFDAPKGDGEDNSSSSVKDKKKEGPRAPPKRKNLRSSTDKKDKEGSSEANDKDDINTNNEKEGEKGKDRDKDKEREKEPEERGRRALKKVKSITKNFPSPHAAVGTPLIDHKADTQMELRRDLDVIHLALSFANLTEF